MNRSFPHVQNSYLGGKWMSFTCFCSSYNSSLDLYWNGVISGCFFFWWFFNKYSSQYFFPHVLHSYGISSECKKLCLSKLFLFLKLDLHNIHLNTPSCTFACCVSCFNFLNFFPHIWHLNAFPKSSFSEKHILLYKMVLST